MPRMVEEVMREEVFSQKKPFIFSSATLSNQGSFEYITKSLGISDYLSFSVASPFDYETMMEVHLPSFPKDDTEGKIQYLVEQIDKTEGRALVLAANKQELIELKQKLAGKLKYPVVF